MKDKLKKILKSIIGCVNFTARIYLRNSRFKVPIIGRIGVQHLTQREPWMIELLEKLLRPGEKGVFIDIGANIGQTLLKLRCLYPEMEYYGFEPNPVCCFYLEKLIKVNKFKKVHIFPVAIGASTGVASLYIHGSDDTADSSASLLMDFKDRTIDIQKNIAIFPLSFFQDSFFNGKPIGFVKIDVEGAEIEVIKGSVDFIRSTQPTIGCELLPPINSSTRDATLKKKQIIQQLLLEEKYRFFKILKSARGRLDGIREVFDLAEETLKGEGWDYLFVPESDITYLVKRLDMKVL